MPRKPDPNSLTSRIVQACNVPRGQSVGDLVDITGGHRPSVNATVPVLVRRGLLHRAGSRMLMRYFAQAADALAYAEVFKQERAQAELAKKERRRAYYADKRRAAGKAVRTHSPRVPKARKAPKAPKAPKAASTGRQPRQAKAAGQISIASATTVTMPAHVQIQRAPTPRDDRYTFTPPPGWKGELMREWEQRRSR